MMMRRKLGDITRSDIRLEIVDHKSRAPPDPSKPAGLFRNIETIGSDLKSTARLGPRREGWHVFMPDFMGGSIAAFACEVFRSGRQEPDNTPLRIHDNRAVARRNEGDGISFHTLGYSAGSYCGRCLGVRQQENPLIHLLLTRE